MQWAHEVMYHSEMTIGLSAGATHPALDMVSKSGEVRRYLL